MKILCIDASNLPTDMGFNLEEGKVYEPIETANHDGVDFYLLHVTRYFKYYYNTARFIPLSDKDEMEMQAKKELSISNLFQYLK